MQPTNNNLGALKILAILGVIYGVIFVIIDISALLKNQSLNILTGVILPIVFGMLLPVIYMLLRKNR